MTSPVDGASVKMGDQLRVTAETNLAFIPASELARATDVCLSQQCLDNIDLEAGVDNADVQGRYIRHPDKPFIEVKVCRTAMVCFAFRRRAHFTLCLVSPSRRWRYLFHLHFTGRIIPIMK